MTPRIDRFELKPEHLQLMKEMQVRWQDDEFGAPEIDPKRPYGNSAVLRDLCEILRPENLRTDDDYGGYTHGDSDVPAELWPELSAIHREMEAALQVVLAAQSFEPGWYVTERYQHNWRREDGQS